MIWCLMRVDRLKRVREDRNYTQEQLAELANVQLHQVWRHENGKTTPDGDVVAKYAQALDVSADYLLGISDDPKPNVQISDLTRAERSVIAAWRRGDVIEAARTILNDENAAKAH